MSNDGSSIKIIDQSHGDEAVYRLFLPTACTQNVAQPTSNVGGLVIH
jgi:hypothetical protein